MTNSLTSALSIEGHFSFQCGSTARDRLTIVNDCTNGSCLTPPLAYRGAQNVDPLTKNGSCLIMGATLEPTHERGAIVLTSIDWISFTVPMAVEDGTRMLDQWGRVGEAWRDAFPLSYQMVQARGDWNPRVGRAPYRQALQRTDKGVMLFTGTNINNALVEISGIGCDTLGGDDAVVALLAEVRDRVTRLDVASDILTEVQPNEFAAVRTGRKFSARSEAYSSSGHTVYLGSKSSDRYARVYRYFNPHPRAAFLRVEHVLRAEQARAAVDAINQSGLETFAAQIGNTFGWEHDCWEPEDTTLDKAAAWQPERREGKTVMWLHSQVLPAILKLHRSGVIDARKFWSEMVEPELDKPQG